MNEEHKIELIFVGVLFIGNLIRWICKMIQTSSRRKAVVKILAKAIDSGQKVDLGKFPELMEEP